MLTQWQDKYWKHMVEKYPELERGDSASKTGREHIPPRIFKEAKHLDRQMDRLLSALGEINAFNAKSKADEVGKLLKQLAPQMEDFFTQARKYESAIRSLEGEKGTLTQTVASLQEKLKAAGTESVKKRLADAAVRVELEVRDRVKRVNVWLTNAESEDPALKESLKPIYQEYKDKKYLVAVYESGNENLEELTKDLLLYNRVRLRELEIEKIGT